MTDEEKAEYQLLKMKTPDTHKFAIDLTYRFFKPEEGAALERLMLRDWVRLIDVCPLAASPGRIFRVFRVMPDAVTWFNKQG